VADQAVAKNDVRDLPIAARTYIWQRVQARNDRGGASRLVAERLVGEFRQFRNGFANGRHRILQSVAVIPPYPPAHRITTDIFAANATNKRATAETAKADAVSLKRAIAGAAGGRRSGIAKAITRGQQSKIEANATARLKQIRQQTPLQYRGICEANHNTFITPSSL